MEHMADAGSGVYEEDLRHVFFHIGLGVFVREMSQKALARYSHC